VLQTAQATATATAAAPILRLRAGALAAARTPAARRFRKKARPLKTPYGLICPTQ